MDPFVLFLVTALTIYFIPAFVAYGRGHHNRAAILVLNLLLGWSFIGWVVALVWSCTATQASESGQPSQEARAKLGEHGTFAGFTNDGQEKRFKYIQDGD